MSDAAVRTWAAAQGIDVPDGLIPSDVVVAYLAREHPSPAPSAAALRVQEEASSAWAALRAQVADPTPAPRPTAARHRTTATKIARRTHAVVAEHAARDDQVRIARDERRRAAATTERDRSAADLVIDLRDPAPTAPRILLVDDEPSELLQAQRGRAIPDPQRPQQR